MFIICSSLLINYSTFTVFLLSVKALIEHVSSSIIDIIIVNSNVNGPPIYSWVTPFFISKVSNFTSSSLTDCLQLV